MAILVGIVLVVLLAESFRRSFVGGCFIVAVFVGVVLFFIGLARGDLD